MKPSHFFFVTLLLSIFIYSISFTQQYAIGGGLSYAIENSNVKGAAGFEAHFTFLTESALAVRASVGRFGSEVKVDKLTEGDYSLLWIEGTLLAQAKGGSVQPYGGLGIGYYITGHEISSKVNNAFYSIGLRVKEDIEDIAGIHLRGGINIPVSATVDFNADVKYVFLKPKDNAEATNLQTFQSATNSLEVDLSTLFINVGFSIRL